MRERTRSRLHRLDTTSSEALGPPKEDDAATPHSVFGRTPIQPDLLNSDWQTQSSCRGIQYALLLCLLKLTAQIPNSNSSQILGHMIRPGPVPADRNSCGCCGAVSAPEVIAEGTRTAAIQGPGKKCQESQRSRYCKVPKLRIIPSAS